MSCSITRTVASTSRADTVLRAILRAHQFASERTSSRKLEAICSAARTIISGFDEHELVFHDAPAEGNDRRVTLDIAGEDDVDEDGGVSGSETAGDCGSVESCRRQERTKNDERESRMQPANAIVAGGRFARRKYAAMSTGDARLREADCGIRFAS